MMTGKCTKKKRDIDFVLLSVFLLNTYVYIKLDFLIYPQTKMYNSSGVMHYKLKYSDIIRRISPRGRCHMIMWLFINNQVYQLIARVLPSNIVN